ncbi:hypothetical protein M2347_001975 [Chryseobacterium sp. H1D6B]|uniref:hypothetical protein n=1 Tax=Chryseobacterium sp. H1D6B TaxID=2940588 RepID=UPI0015C9723A|nr:hypothetical protein [Chryseobacterium sp. H1D6B]MDH6252248.1 hypothetical protein [Chryseobacterium sp. H1D6B]
MLVQSPSKIFKADFAVWKQENSCRINEIVSDKDDAGILRKVTEIVLDENGSCILKPEESSIIMILTLYGKIQINGFEKIVSSRDVFTLKTAESLTLNIINTLSDEKADLLIFEMKSQKQENSFSIEELQINQRNMLIPISGNLELPNFIGLYEGRMEQEYSLYHSESQIFGMVVNGAFEFQNRLMETRDAVLLQEIETLEFEALSENALIIFLEI